MCSLMLFDLVRPHPEGLFGFAEPWALLLVAVTAVLIGAAVQSMIGLGLGLIAAPVISFLDPTLMPGVVLITAVLLPLLTLLQEWRHVDWRGVAWGVPARVPGTILAVWVVAVLEPRFLAGLIGVMVLVAVGLSVWSVRVRITPVSLVAAGALSGLTGTATSVGGPPMALLYQYERPARMRATLAAFFLVGATVSLAALGLGGQLDERTVAVGLLMIPVVAAGFGLGNLLRRWVNASMLRVVMLCVVTLSAFGLLLQVVLG